MKTTTSLATYVDPNPMATAMRQLIAPTMNFLRDEMMRTEFDTDTYRNPIAINLELRNAEPCDTIDALGRILKESIDAGGKAVPSLYHIRRTNPTIEFTIFLGRVFGREFMPVRALCSLTLSTNVTWEEFTTLLDNEFYNATYIRDLFIAMARAEYPNEEDVAHIFDTVRTND